MLGDILHTHDKIHLVPTTGRAVAAKAGPGVSARIHLHARGLIIMEGTAQSLIAVALKTVVLQDGVYRKALFDLMYFHKFIFSKSNLANIWYKSIKYYLLPKENLILIHKILAVYLQIQRIKTGLLPNIIDLWILLVKN
jgi:hypothetical protein